MLSMICSLFFKQFPSYWFTCEIILIDHKLSLKRDILIAKKYNSGLLLLIKREIHIENIACEVNSCKKDAQKSYNRLAKDKTTLLCDLHCCDTGLLRSCIRKCDNVYENVSQSQQQYIYIGFIKSKEFEPHSKKDVNNTTGTVEMGNYDDEIFRKLAYRHNYNIFNCLKYKERKIYEIHNNNQETNDMVVRKHKTVFVLAPENDCHKSDTLEVNIASGKPNLFLEQRQ
uniref:Fam-e protein n=1 Tax=Strongyloides venezuelensis TaxID=75913 RepID=A0A0K0G559_STRVS